MSENGITHYCLGNGAPKCTCERDLTEESLDRLLDEIERDDPAEALH